jgi:hypothetical protein
MASWTLPASHLDQDDQSSREPGARGILAAILLALVFVFLTRWPVARTIPLETDEHSFLEEVSVGWFPMHHTLFKTLARLLGLVVGDHYRGFIVLDMVTSALALAGLWWWLRALVSPATAAAAALMLGVGPIFWGYGAVAGNYTAIVLVGSLLLGVAIRGDRRPERWHPFAAAAILAAGTGYRPDVGVLWLPVFLVILWRHRWRQAILAGIGFGLLNLAWAGAMIVEVGGWERYRAATAQFAHSAGALNSAWNLGLIDGSVRYAVKMAMALIWTLGPALLFVPRGLARLRRQPSAGFLAVVLFLSAAPALAFHLLIHFGVPGYSFHYLPALMALVVLGIGRGGEAESEAHPLPGGRGSVPRLLGLAAVLAAAFWFYPTDYSAPGWRGDFDLAFCRLTRHGLNALAPRPSPSLWRTANSPKSAGAPASRVPGDSMTSM